MRAFPGITAQYVQVQYCAAWKLRFYSATLWLLVRVPIERLSSAFPFPRKLALRWVIPQRLEEWEEAFSVLHPTHFPPPSPPKALVPPQRRDQLGYLRCAGAAAVPGLLILGCTERVYGKSVALREEEVLFRSTVLQMYNTNCCPRPRAWLFPLPPSSFLLPPSSFPFPAPLRPFLEI